jgi:hypothetical protein
MKYQCDFCDKMTDGKYSIDDLTYCEDCMNDAIDRAEMAYESQREDGLNL